MKTFVLINEKGQGVETHYELNEAEFKRKNAEGWGVYFAVNDFYATPEELTKEGVKTRRNIKFLKKINYVFADLDIAKKGDGQTRKEKEAKKDALLFDLYDVLPPTMIIDTSNGVQPLWRLSGATTEASYQQRYVDVINAIIEWSKSHGGAGDKVKDVTRVLRLPGYNHMKEEPFMCTAKHEDKDLIYPLEELERKFLVYLPKKEVKPVHKINTGLDDLSLAIGFLDIKELAVRAFASIGRRCEFDKQDRLILDGRLTGSFKSDKGEFIASTSHEPFQGNRLTVVADIKQVSNKEARAWIIEEFGLRKASPRIKESLSAVATPGYTVDVMSKIFTWGTEGLDKGISPMTAGQLNFITGTTGMGKTTFSFDVAQKNALLGHRVLYMSLEQSKQDIIDRLARSSAGITKQEWRDKKLISLNKNMRFKMRVNKINEMKDLILYGFGKEIKPTTENVFAVIREVKPDLVFLDNFDDIAKDQANEYGEQNRVTQELKHFTQETGIPINVLHHRNAKKAQGGIGAVRGSGKITDMAWTCLKCYRDWDDDASPQENAKFFVKHEKDRDFGTFGLVVVYWQNGTFNDDYL